MTTRDDCPPPPHSNARAVIACIAAGEARAKRRRLRLRRGVPMRLVLRLVDAWENLRRHDEGRDWLIALVLLAAVAALAQRGAL